MNQRHFCKSLVLTLPLLLAASLHAADVANLRCEYLADPLGIDVLKPRLSWVIESAQRGERQTAYQVMVASTSEFLAKGQGDLWDSGKVASEQSTLVEYGGKPLVSGMRYEWKVRVWDHAGKASEWSKPAAWTMGILKPEDWTARWISTEMEAQAVTPKTGGKLKILKATYTARDGAGSADVTGKVSALVKDGVLISRLRPGYSAGIRR